MTARQGARAAAATRSAAPAASLHTGAAQHQTPTGPASAWCTGKYATGAPSAGERSKSPPSSTSTAPSTSPTSRVLRDARRPNGIFQRGPRPAAALASRGADDDDVALAGGRRGALRAQ
mmetsp:Transcript_4338/g.15260  ORF Transcript_4338/g.15260 Transcript_4338/m.15260 type:complete len:119 (+) Transcript_4338:152-508(+)